MRLITTIQNESTQVSSNRGGPRLMQNPTKIVKVLLTSNIFYKMDPPKKIIILINSNNNNNKEKRNMDYFERAMISYGYFKEAVTSTIPTKVLDFHNSQHGILLIRIILI
jgi:hypothetical protein